MPKRPGRKNVFILGLDSFQQDLLQSLRDVDGYAFHGLLDFETVVRPATYAFNDLLQSARHQLRAFPGTVDAVIAHWDFPTSILAPILCREHGIPAPSLESVLKCEHKLWSRLEQQRAIPAHIPRFTGFDPFDARALDNIGLAFPFWIKPVKSFSSQLGFMIRNRDDFECAVQRIRSGIGRVGNAFDEVLRLSTLPLAIRQTSGRTCIAEEIIYGVQAAPEGSMSRGEFNVHGVIDMEKDPSGRSFDRLVYPSRLPARVQRRMAGICERLLRHIGFDNGCFNAEFMWDRARDSLVLVEVNCRISQSHSDLFVKVDGVTNHQVAMDVAMGARPTMPRRGGPFRIAAKCLIPHDMDGVVMDIPDDQALQRIGESFPGTRVRLDVLPGMRLSTMPNQDSYRYVLGAVYIGANDRRQLQRTWRNCLTALRFRVQPPPLAPPMSVGTARARLTLPDGSAPETR